MNDSAEPGSMRWQKLGKPGQPTPFARLEALNNTIDLFFEQLKIEARDQAGAYTN